MASDRTSHEASGGRAALRAVELRRRKAEGDHPTPTALADLLSELALHELEGGPDGLGAVLDPACGDGVLLDAVVRAVVPATRAGVTLDGWEADATVLERARRRLEPLGVAAVRLHEGDFLEAPTGGAVGGPFDLVIANPPFVRTQVLGAARAGDLARRFGLSDRVDLYQAFVAALADRLRPGGVLALIAPNRILSVRSGRAVRERLWAAFELRTVVDLGDTRLFAASVLPALIVARRRGDEGRRRAVRFVRIYEARTARERDPHAIGEPGSEVDAAGLMEGEVRQGEPCPAEIRGDEAGKALDRSEYPTVLEALRRGVEGCFRAAGRRFELERGWLRAGEPPGGPWCLAGRRDRGWRDAVEAASAGPLGERAGRVHVGIKTTADHVFVRGDWESLPEERRPEPALLRPLLTHREAVRWARVDGPTSARVLYPHAVRDDGHRVAVDLDAFPRATAYLNGYRAALEARAYVARAHRLWYEIWVPQDPGAWAGPKVVFPDITEFPRAFLDATGAVVQGDCYWIRLEPGRELSTLYLALAVLNSSLATAYYDARFHNKLYAGRRRFLSQYVAAFPMPNPSHPAARAAIEEVRRLVSDPAARDLAEEVDRLVWAAFGVSPPAGVE